MLVEGNSLVVSYKHQMISICLQENQSQTFYINIIKIMLIGLKNCVNLFLLKSN